MFKQVGCVFVFVSFRCRTATSSADCLGAGGILLSLPLLLFFSFFFFVFFPLLSSVYVLDIIPAMHTSPSYSMPKIIQQNIILSDKKPPDDRTPLFMFK